MQDNKLIKTVVIFGIVLAVLITAYVMTGAGASADGKKLRRLKSEVKSLEGKIFTAKSNLAKEKEFKKKLANFNPKYLPKNTNYNSESSRIRVLSPLMDSLKRKHRMNKVSVKVSNLTESKHSNNLKSLKLYEGEVQIGFESLTGSNAMAFAYDLITNNISGYVQMNKFSLSKRGELTQQLLYDISDTGHIPSLVSGELLFTWTTMSDTNNALADKPKVQEGQK